LTCPLRDRFASCSAWSSTYRGSHQDRGAQRGHLEAEASAGGATRIAERSRGTPRIANRLLRRARDFAEVRPGASFRRGGAGRFDMLEVDPQGFDTLDRKLLLTVIEKFEGGPVGVDSLAAAMSEERARSRM